MLLAEPVVSKARELEQKVAFEKAKAEAESTYS
jgi:hypothetical protein